MPAPTWRRYLRFWRSDVNADLDEEFRFHVDAQVEYLVARGWSPEAARDEALREFGDVDAFRRDCRAADERRMGRAQRKETFAVLAQDLRYATRSLRRQPAFTAIAVLTLALGIGANTAIFSVIDGVLLTPLPYREPNRLVMLWETMPGGDRPLVSYPNYLDWRQRQRSFEDIAAYNPFASFTMTGRGDAQRVDGFLVTPQYLQLLGIQPAIGRLIAARDDSSGAARVVLLGNGFFQSRFAGDPAVIGRTLLLDNIAYTVVGVLEPDMSVSYRPGDREPDVVLPLGLFVKESMYTRTSPVLFGVGRLKPGISIERALADLQRVSTELRAEYPKEDAGIGAGGAPLIDRVVWRIKPRLEILTVAVAFVLLIACANVANLVLSRSTARQREFALRTALGAARGRIVRQVLTESIVLALAGGVLGVGIAVLGVKMLPLVVDPRGIPRFAQIAVNQKVLVFALGLSVLTGVLFGLAPALHAGTTQLMSALKDGGRGASGASKQRTRSALTIAEVAFAVLLLAGAGLLMRSFAKLAAVDVGFQSSHVVVGAVDLSPAKYPTVEQARAALDELLGKLRAIPGVESATLGSSTPISPHSQSVVSFQSRAEPNVSKLPLLNVAVVEPNYFATLRIALAAGRMLATSDVSGQPPVVVISERVARKFFGRKNPVGERLALGQAGSTWRTIVGVVKETPTDGLGENPRGTVYLPRGQEEMLGGWLMVRSMLPTEQVARLVRERLREEDRDVPLEGVQTMDAALGEQLEEPKLSMLMLTIFAAVALALASVGIYGVISYNVTQRTNEIGVRVALGAQRRDVVGLVVGQAMAMAAVGVGIGVLLALWSGKGLSRMLFGVGPRDPLALGGASAFLLLVALIAALAPALRASRIDPTIAMRAD